MMVNVKETMDKWRKLFISQAQEGEHKLGLDSDQQKIQRPLVYVDQKS